MKIEKYLLKNKEKIVLIMGVASFMVSLLVLHHIICIVRKIILNW